MRSRSTIEFLGLWGKLNNPDFKLVDFDRFRTEAGSNYFVLSPKKWIDSTNQEFKAILKLHGVDHVEQKTLIW